jgi:hypothetical protein
LWWWMKTNSIASSSINQCINCNMGTFPVHLPSSAAFCSSKVAHTFSNWSFCLFISPTSNSTPLCHSPISSFCESMGWSFNQTVLWSTPHFLSNAGLPQKTSMHFWASTLLRSRVGMTKVPPWP